MSFLAAYTQAEGSSTAVDSSTEMYDVRLPLLPFPNDAVDLYQSKVSVILAAIKKKEDAANAAKPKKSRLDSLMETGEKDEKGENEASNDVLPVADAITNEARAEEKAKSDDKSTTSDAQSQIEVKEEYTLIEEVEAYEGYGIALYYSGNYHEASNYLIKAINKLKTDPSRDLSDNTFRLNVYAGLAFYRLGEVTTADKHFGGCTSKRKQSSNPVYAAIALSNSGLCKLYLEQNKDAIERAKDGLALAFNHYNKDGNGKSNETLLHHARVLLAIYIKTGFFDKAEGILDDYDFNRKEAVIIRAGCRFAGGKYDSAYSLLEEEALRQNESIDENSSLNREEKLIKKWVNNILDSQIQYNMICLNSRKNKHDIFATDRALVPVCSYLDERNAEVKEQNKYGNPFFAAKPDKLPNFTPFDTDLATAAIVSHILISKLEQTFLTADFRTGIDVQLGITSGCSDEDASQETEAIDRITTALTTALSLINHTQFNQKPSYDITATKEGVGNYSSFLTLAHLKPTGTDSDKSFAAMSNEVSSHLKNKFGIVINEKTGQKLPPGTPAVAEADSANRKKKIDFNKSYVSTTHDGITVRNEIMTLSKRIGNTEATYWIQWALCNSNGAGWGYMCTLSPNSTPENGIVVAGAGASAIGMKVQETYLKEVRSRLTEVEYDFSSRFEHDPLYRQGDKETRILLLITLAKISAQLNMRKECSAHVTQLEQLAMSLRDAHPRNGQNNDFFYIAMAKKLRYDLEEWNLSAISFPDKRLEHMLVMLGMAKEYVKYASYSVDVHVRRDAYKKLINTYLDISNAPLPTGAEVLPPGTLEKLLNYSPKDIEEREARNTSWTKQFARVRAEQFLKKFKEAINPVHEEFKERAETVEEEVEKKNNEFGSDDDDDEDNGINISSWDE